MLKVKGLLLSGLILVVSSAFAGNDNISKPSSKVVLHNLGTNGIATSKSYSDYDASAKEAYVIGISLGYSRALGDYAKVMDLLSASNGFNLRVDFSARLYEMLAARVEYGAFAHSGTAGSGSANDPRLTLSTGYLGLGPELRFKVFSKSQIALYATLSSTATVASLSGNGISNQVITNSGSGFAIGGIVRTPLTSRVCFLGNLEYRSARNSGATSNISVFNLNAGLGINFGR